MISKKTFCEALELVKEQEQIDENFSNALETVCDGWVIYGTNNKYKDALLMVLKETMNDKYDYIDWWLYDATNDYKVIDPETNREWCLEEPEILYDYIVDECQ